MATVGTSLVYSIIEPLPAKGFPQGRIRWRIRHDEFVLARVKTADGIREFYVKEEDGYWVPFVEKARNADAKGQITVCKASLSLAGPKPRPKQVDRKPIP